MDSSTAHPAFAGNFQIRHPGIFDQERKNFLIDGIDLITWHNLQFIRTFSIIGLLKYGKSL